MHRYSRHLNKKVRRSVVFVAIVVSLVLSAYLISVALRTAHFRWLGWFGFLPLFVATRWSRPVLSALAGGLWGACLYFFSAGGLAPEVQDLAPAILPSATLLALLIVIPAVYVGLAARRGQAIGFKLLTLALGWTLVEAVLHLSTPSGTHDGLLTGSHAEPPHLHWLARLFGYVFAAFLVACANASLVGIVIRARLRFPACKSPVGSPTVVGRLLSPLCLAIQSWTLRRAYPRAPPD